MGNQYVRYWVVCVKGDFVNAPHKVLEMLAEEVSRNLRNGWEISGNLIAIDRQPGYLLQPMLLSCEMQQKQNDERYLKLFEINRAAWIRRFPRALRGRDFYEKHEKGMSWKNIAKESGMSLSATRAVALTYESILVYTKKVPELELLWQGFVNSQGKA